MPFIGESEVRIIWSENHMKFLPLETSIFLVIFFCAVSVFAQSSEDWIAGYKTDDIEAFYRFEKSGSDTYEVEVKVINRRAKDVDVVIKIEQKDINVKPIKKITNQGVADRLQRLNEIDRNSKYIKLTVKAKETSVSEKAEVDKIEDTQLGAKIVCWSNIDSKKKCDLESFLPRNITPPIIRP
jgi:hypothetical protein